jgi:hypothetical protein
MDYELPNDSDGDALRRLIATGSDLSKEMEVDFAMDVPDRETGLAFAAVAAPLGFRTDVDRDDPTGRWTCYCSRKMVASYDAIVSIQQTLEQMGRPYDAKPDGWGSICHWALQNPPLVGASNAAGV